MSNSPTTDVIFRLKQAAMAQAAANPALVKALLAGGAGALVGGGLTGLLVHSHDAAEKERAKNMSFGAGVATGLAGPHLVDALQHVTHRGMP
jgi:zinc transporter ZupT